MDYSVRQKVLAYIVRARTERLEHLVFDHVGIPEAGTQVPAGSVDPQESADQAVLREVFEETGASALTILRFLGVFPWFCASRKEIHERHVLLLSATQPLPDVWTHRVSAGVEDKGLEFRCYWMDVSRTVDSLAADQGAYLTYVKEPGDP